MTTERPDATIVVFQERDWFGDPRLGAFTVSVDRKQVGRVAVNGSSTFPVSAGTHTVRIRQWWYRSPSITLNVPSGADARLRADVPRSLSFLRRMGRFLFAPSACLVLESTSDAPEGPGYSA
jgi:hypothetical protein